MSDPVIPDLPKRRARPLAQLRESLQDRLAKLHGKPTGGMRTDVSANGVPVIFLHNPKTGGNSLGKLLNVGRLSHSFASKRLSEAAWLSHFSVAVVRDPFDRFLSGYFSHIRRPDMNGLVKIYGPEIKGISPLQYLQVLKENPKYGGPQTLWTDYPSTQKPRADLVLRQEASEGWVDALQAHGIDLQGRSLSHANASQRDREAPQVQLGLDDVAFATLRSAVHDHFRSDYETFDYPAP